MSKILVIESCKDFYFDNDVIVVWIGFHVVFAAQFCTLLVVYGRYWCSFFDAAFFDNEC